MGSKFTDTVYANSDVMEAIFEYMVISSIVRLQQTNKSFCTWFTNRWEKAHQQSLTTDLLNRAGHARDHRLSKQGTYLLNRILDRFSDDKDFVVETHKSVQIGRGGRTRLMQISVARADGRCSVGLLPSNIAFSDSWEVRLQLITPKALENIMEWVKYTQDQCQKLGFTECTMVRVRDRDLSCEQEWMHDYDKAMHGKNAAKTWEYCIPNCKSACKMFDAGDGVWALVVSRKNISGKGRHPIAFALPRKL